MSSASAVTISQEDAIARIERATSIRLYFPVALEQAAGAPSAEEATLVIYPYDGDETRCVVRSDGPS